MFDSGSVNKQCLYLLFDRETKHYNVITNITGCMAVRYICKGCNKRCQRGEFHSCKSICSDCLKSPPCELTNVRKPCEVCNRCFRSDTCFKNHKQTVISGKTVCERKRCTTCKAIIMPNHKCFHFYCSVCQKQRECGHKNYISVYRPKFHRVKRCSMCFMTLRQRRTLHTLTMRFCMYQTWFVCNNFATNAKTITM